MQQWLLHLVSKKYCFSLPPFLRPKPTQFPFSRPSHRVDQTRHTKKEAFAAVTVPCGLTKAGFNLAICCRVEIRTPLSAVTVSVRPERRQRIDEGQ